MTYHLTFILDKSAENTESDKYKEKNNDNFIIYIPQTISRKFNNNPKKELRISID